MDDRNWFCVRTQPKHEQIAATYIRRTLALEVFSPRLRIRKVTQRGAVWFHDPLFPGYIFARFNWQEESQVIRCSRGVSTLVTFGSQVPVVPDAVIEMLRSGFDASECHEVPETLQCGDVVTIGGGPFHGLQATVLRVMTPSQRIRVLLEIMGGVQPLEVPIASVVRENGEGNPGAGRTPFHKEEQRSSKG